MYKEILWSRTMAESIFDLKCLNAKETEAAGARLADFMKQGNCPRFVALCGGLGAGKTAFTRGFCSVMCPGATVRSPSFAIVNEYRGDPDVYHFDVWRIKDDDDLYSTGFYDYADRKGIVVCEWADSIAYALPESYIKVKFDGNGDDPRHIVAELIKGDEVTVC